MSVCVCECGWERERGGEGRGEGKRFRTPKGNFLYRPLPFSNSLSLSFSVIPIFIRFFFQFGPIKRPTKIRMKIFNFEVIHFKILHSDLIILTIWGILSCAKFIFCRFNGMYIFNGLYYWLRLFCWFDSDRRPKIFLMTHMYLYLAKSSFLTSGNDSWNLSLDSKHGILWSIRQVVGSYLDGI